MEFQKKKKKKKKKEINWNDSFRKAQNSGSENIFEKKY